MQLSPLMNIIGGMLIIGSIVIHIICLSTPHYITSDPEKIKALLTKVIQSQLNASLKAGLNSQAEGMIHHSQSKRSSDRLDLSSYGQEDGDPSNMDPNKPRGGSDIGMGNLHERQDSSKIDWSKMPDSSKIDWSKMPKMSDGSKIDWSKMPKMQDGSKIDLSKMPKMSEGSKIDLSNMPEMDGLGGDPMEKAVGILGSATFNVGLWKVCIHAPMGFATLDFCAKWASETKSNDKGMTSSFKTPSWIRWAQAMAILGLLVTVLTGVLAAIHLFVPSRGDRLRLLPKFICASTFVAAAIILCGVLIIAGKYRTFFTSMAGAGNEMPPPEFAQILEGMFTLSWGFALDVVSSALILLAGLFFVISGCAAQDSGMV